MVYAGLLRMFTKKLFAGRRKQANVSELSRYFPSCIACDEAGHNRLGIIRLKLTRNAPFGIFVGPPIG